MLADLATKLSVMADFILRGTFLNSPAPISVHYMMFKIICHVPHKQCAKICALVRWFVFLRVTIVDRRDKLLCEGASNDAYLFV